MESEVEGRGGTGERPFFFHPSPPSRAHCGCHARLRRRFRLAWGRSRVRGRAGPQEALGRNPRCPVCEVLDGALPLGRQSPILDMPPLFRLRNSDIW